MARPIANMKTRPEDAAALEELRTALHLTTSDILRLGIRRLQRDVRRAQRERRSLEPFVALLVEERAPRRVPSAGAT